MAKTVDFDIVGSYNNQRVTNIDPERTVNMFEYRDPLGKKPKTLLPTSGLVNTNYTFGTQTKGFRAQYVLLGYEYLVVGSGIYRIDSNNVLTTLGAFSTDEGYVGIDANEFQIIFVDGVNGYIWDTTALTMVQITDPAFPIAPIDVCTLDQYFVVANGNTNQFQLSSLNQGLVWGPDNNSVLTSFTMAGAQTHLVLTFSGGSISNYQVGTPIELATSTVAELPISTTFYVQSIVNSTTITVSATLGGAPITSAAGGNGTFSNNGQLQLGQVTTHPGNIVACRTLHRRLFLFSQNFTEIWENAGIGTTLPFRRNNSLLMEYGTPAIGSVSVGFDLLFFLSQDRDGLGSVMMVAGTESMPVSTRALDFALARFAATSSVSDCRGFLVKENGLIFYRMNFTEANHTFVYNVSQSVPTSDETKFWHEEEVLNGDRHPAQTHGYFNGKNYVGSYDSPILYRLSSSIYLNGDENIRRMRITRALVPPGYQRMRIDRLQIDLLQGDIDNIRSQFDTNPLQTENLEYLLTEDGLTIDAEQDLMTSNPDDLFVFLSLSKDGGQTYGYLSRAPMGEIGQRTYRTLWRKLGTTVRGQPFVCKFEFFNDYPFIILGASWAMELLPE